jgi:hypothetical protein
MTSTSTEAITSTATRATWSQHGKPTKGFEFWGTAVKGADAKPFKVSKVTADAGKITIHNGGGRVVAEFAPTTKFWAVVPADAPRVAAPAKVERAPRAEVVPLVISAPSKSDAWVKPIDGAVKSAVDALVARGGSVMGMCRQHGQNPSQIRRLMADSVAKVDALRAASIADALGVKLDTLFSAGSAKGAKPSAPSADASAKPSADAKPSAPSADAKPSAPARAARKPSARERARTAGAAQLKSVK